jgi:hypothetical protein
VRNSSLLLQIITSIIIAKNNEVYYHRKEKAGSMIDWRAVQKGVRNGRTGPRHVDSSSKKLLGSFFPLNSSCRSWIKPPPAAAASSEKLVRSLSHTLINQP